MKGYQIAADLKLVKNTAKELSKGYSSTTVKTVQSGYTDYEKLFHSKKAWYETRGIVALCEGCGEELESIQKDARGVVVCNKCLEYGKRGVAALCCDCNKELTESQIAFERGIITKLLIADVWSNLCPHTPVITPSNESIIAPEIPK